MDESQTFSSRWSCPSIDGRIGCTPCNSDVTCIAVLRRSRSRHGASDQYERNKNANLKNASPYTVSYRFTRWCRRLSIIHLRYMADTLRSAADEFETKRKKRKQPTVISFFVVRCSTTRLRMTSSHHRYQQQRQHQSIRPSTDEGTATN